MSILKKAFRARTLGLFALLPALALHLPSFSQNSATDDAASVKTAVNTVTRGQQSGQGMPLFGAPNLPTPASGYSDAQLVDVFNKVGGKGGTPNATDFGAAVANYAKLQELHANGAISNEVFQNCMKSHFSIVEDIFKKSAPPGTVVTGQMKTSEVFKLFSDGDYHIAKPDGSQLSFDEFMKLQENIKKNFNEFFEKAKVPIDSNANFNQVVNADVMIKDPSKLSEAQRQLYQQWMDQFGGVLYKNGLAIEMEKISRSIAKLSEEAAKGNAAAAAELKALLAKVTPEMASAYANEVLGHADDFVNAARMLREQAASMTDAAAKTQLLNQANACEALASKYIERVNASSKILSQAQGTAQNMVSNSAQELIEKAGKRTAETLQDAAEFGANYQRIRQEAVESLAKTIDDVSKANPQLSKACQEAVEGLKKTMADAAHAPTLPGSALPPPPVPQPGKLFVTPEQFLSINKVLGAAGFILNVFDAYDILKDLYNKQWLSAGFRGFMLYATTKLGAAAAPYIAGAYAAHPVVITGIMVFATSYALTRQVMERLGLDASVQRWMADNLMGGKRADAEALQEINRQFQSALDKGHRLANGMSPQEAWQKVVDNYNKGGRIYSGVFQSPGASSSGQAFIQNSTLISEFEGKLKSSNGSIVNTGIKGKGATVRDSTISTYTKGAVTADNKSEINTGVKIEGAQITNKSNLSTHTEGKITAKDGSKINTGIDADKAIIKGSSLTTINKADLTATGKSEINTGIQADGAKITDSQITAINTGKITASDKSKVNTGVQADGAKITNSEIFTRNTGKITASQGSKVNTGVQAKDATITDSKISVKNNADIDASKGSKVNAGLKLDEDGDSDPKVNTGSSGF